MEKDLLSYVRLTSLRAYIRIVKVSEGQNFAPDQLLAVLTRDLATLGISPAPDHGKLALFPPHIFSYEGYTLDLLKRSLTKPDREAVLINSNIRAIILRTLISCGGEVVPYLSFMRDLGWKEETDPTDLRVNIMRIRKSIGDQLIDSRHYKIIKSVQGKGYIFDPPRLS